MLEAEKLESVREFLACGQHYLLTTHVRPDGDALGSVVAMRRWLSRAGKGTTVLLLSPPPRRYRSLTAGEPILILGEAGLPSACRQADHVIIADTSVVTQLQGLEKWLANPPGPVMVLDHHVSTDDIGQIRLIDTTASATGIILAELIDELGGLLDRELAEPLFVAIATDTGWFRFSNTDARTLRWAARLLDAGLKADALHQNIYQSEQASRLRLLGEMLSSLELYEEDRLAVVCLSQEMFRRCGASMGDTENLIDEPQRIGSVLAVALLVELPDGRVRISLRSKRTVDVNAVAGQFGGGGHIRAAGAHTKGDLQQARREVVRALAQALREGEDDFSAS